MFKHNEFIEDLSEFSISSEKSTGMVSTFDSCYNLKKLPKMTGYIKNLSNLNSIGNVITDCYTLSQEEIQKLLDDIYEYQKDSSPQGTILGYNYQLKELD